MSPLIVRLRAAANTRATATTIDYDDACDLVALLDACEELAGSSGQFSHDTVKIAAVSAALSQLRYGIGETYKPSSTTTIDGARRRR